MFCRQNLAHTDAAQYRRSRAWQSSSASPPPFIGELLCLIGARCWTSILLRHFFAYHHRYISKFALNQVPMRSILGVYVGIGQSPERLAAVVGCTAIECCVNLSCGGFGIGFQWLPCVFLQKSSKEMRYVQVSDVSNRTTHNRFKKLVNHHARAGIVKVH